MSIENLKSVNEVKIFLITISCIVILIVFQTLPVFLLRPFGAKEFDGKNVIVFYQSGDEKGAKEVYDVLENSAGEIRGKLDFASKRPTGIYMYTNQKSLWIRKYGLITIFAAPGWYIGDNKADKVLMVSPYANVSGNDHNSILTAATHELVHTINYQINPRLSYWIDNGVATYIAKQSPKKGFIQYNAIPSIYDMKCEDEIKFGNIGGYQYSYTYIEFLDKKYRWNKVLDLIKGEKTYNEIFLKSDMDIYNEWVEFLKANY